MPLCRLAGVGNFCFNLLSPFLSIVRILLSQAILFQILLYALFSPISLASPSFFLFQVILSSITSSIWEMMYRWMTRQYHRRSFELYLWSSQQHPPCPEEHQSTTYRPVSSHTSSWSYDAPPHATSPHPQQYVPTFHNSTTKPV